MRLLRPKPPVTHAVRWEPCEVTDGRTVTVTVGWKL